MKKGMAMVGFCLAGIGSLALAASVPSAPTASVEQAAPEGAGVPTQQGQPGQERQQGQEARAARDDVAGLGLRCAPVSADLAAHLGLEPGVGLVVASVRADSPADRAGLEVHDVIVELDGEPARAEVLAAGIRHGGGLALRVVRAGLERNVPLVAGTGESQDAFLSSDTLGPDHPFRRLGQIQALRQSYASEAERYGELLRELDQETRQTREEAKRAMAALQEECEAEMASVLDEHQARLLAITDAGLTGERVEPLRALRIDTEELFPSARLSAVDESLAELAAGLRELHAERVRAADDAGDAPKRATQRLSRLASQASSLVDERMRRPWSSARKEVQQHQNRLGPEHDQRVVWAANTVESIRREVDERILCAVRRSKEELSKQLRDRLRDMEVPRPGEVEAMLDDLVAQLDQMTHRFVTRTEAALDRYEARVAGRNALLVPAAAAHLATGEAAVADATSAVDALLERTFAGPLVVDGSWQSRARVDAVVDELNAGLLRIVNDGRDGVRAGAVGLTTDLNEQCVVSEDAWKDLRSALQSLLEQASNDCWKLDGPHLDGRFPKPPEGEKGEVAMATR